ncbi:beta-lactamase/transpeptidase-like protein [Rhexocercosporidium sp. MPI-PUGE-AT-0058]|nr:beta-lactamase/transpeptidase-like protein [Rhexocercosporidium sp. MPI-PUGE-AT-0058]
MSASTDITNWRQLGHHIWGFQNVDKLLKVDQIRRPSEASRLASVPHNFDSFKLDITDKKSLDLFSFLSQTETDGIVVLKDGNIVFEHYIHTNTEKSIHIAFSTSKSPSALVDASDNLPFEYISTNADLMGWVIERVTGKKFAEVVSELIWQPMGAESDAYITLDHGGNARTAAALCTTATLHVLVKSYFMALTV